MEISRDSASSTHRLLNHSNLDRGGSCEVLSQEGDASLCDRTRGTEASGGCQIRSLGSAHTNSHSLKILIFPCR